MMLKVKAIVATAGLSVDKKLKDLRKEIQELREERLRDVDVLWRDKQRGDGTPRSDNGSIGKAPGSPRPRLSTDGIGTPRSSASLEDVSTAGSDEKMLKTQALVVAAGMNFTRQLNDVKKQVRELRKEFRDLRNDTNGRLAEA